MTTFLGRDCKYGHGGERYARSGECAHCARLRSIRERADDPEKVSALKRRSYERKKSQYAETSKLWRQKNPDRVRAYSAAWAARNPKKRLESSRAYYARNSDEHAQRVRDWESSNPGARIAISSRRRALVRGADGSWAASDLSEIRRFQGGLCAYAMFCGNHLSAGEHVDHAIPLSRGGTNWPWDIQLTCPRCNLSKGSRDPMEFLKSLFEDIAA